MSPSSPEPAGRPVSLGVWELAWPSILGNLLQASVGMIGAVAVGSLGADALAATTAGERIFFVLQAVLMAITAGTTALVARAWGAGEREEAARVARTSVAICTGIAVTAAVPGMLFARELAGIFRLDDATLALAATYIRWLLAFNPAFAIFVALAAALRAAGDARTPLWMGGLANLLNGALLFPLVFGSFGFPSLGVRGAALAGGSAFSISSALFLWLWWSGRLVVARGSGPVLERARIRRLLWIGLPAGLEQGVFQAGFILFLWIVSFYGTEPYAAYGIGVRILSFSFVVGSGFSIAAATLVGQHLGAGDPDGARLSGWRAAGHSVGAMSLFGLAIVLAAEPIARFTIDDDEVVRLTVIFIHIFGLVQPLMALEFALGGGLRGAGDTRFPLYNVLAGMLLVRTSLAALALALGLTVEWVFAALIADYAVKATLFVWRFRSGRWQHVIADRAGAGPGRGARPDR